MYRVSRVRRLATAALTLCLLIPALPAAAQSGPARGGARSPQPQQAQLQTADGQTLVRNARETRDAFREVLLQYGDSLGRVLRADPTLMTNQAYLAAYPAVAAFIASYPEVTRDPEYFLASFGQYSSSTAQWPPDVQMRARVLDTYRNLMMSFGGLLMFLTVVLTLTWLIRYFIGHRRWLRATKLQAEMHGRLVERLGSPNELLAYIQSPAGTRFLQATPVVTDEAPASAAAVTAPLGRILWSVQLGVVLASGGLGLLVMRYFVFEEVREVLLTLGGLALSIGAGFGLAALASYVISRRLGLFDGPAGE